MDQKSPKKLVLNRETVRELTREDMEHIEGGYKQPTRDHNCMTPPIFVTVTGDPCKVC